MTGSARIYAAGRVRRWHANPMMAHLAQTNWDHVGGCLALLFMLHPGPSAALCKAVLFHDLGERWVGDLPYDFKRSDPETANRHAAVEGAVVRKALGHDPCADLTREDVDWLHLVDRLEAYLFTAMYQRDELNRNGWPAARDRLLAIATMMEVVSKVSALLQEAEEGLFY